MPKKQLKSKIGLIVILILIALATTIIICVNKNTSAIKTASETIETKNLLDSATVTAQDLNSDPEDDDGSLTYSTAGNDSANYEDGDTSGTRSEWVKNGDTWQYTFYVDDPDAQWYVYEDSSSLMEGYTADYTEYNAGTLFNEETLNTFTPTENMTVSTNSNGKKVYTWLDTENSYKVIDNGDGTYTKITTKLSFTITNYNIDSENSVYYGDLVINKIVKNSDGNVLTENEDSTNFVFTINLTADDDSKNLIEGTKTFSDIVFKDGVATVSLKAGESITISGIPAGVSYTVTERAVDGYETTYDSNSGTIVKDANSTVTFTNQKEPEVPGGETPGGSTQKYVSFAIKKEVTGNYEVEQSYNFEISMSNLKAYTTYNLSNGASFTSDSIGTANISISLKNNETVTVQNIPIGSKYKVYEYAGDYISSYVITDNNNMGLINNSSNNNTKQNTALSTATETADEGEDIIITFTNKKTVTQNLKIVKTVTDENDTNTYTFTIEFANMEKGTSFNTSFGKITADSSGKADATIYLAGGDEAEIYNIPVGTTYKITELASNAIASYTITDANGINKIVKESDANTKNKTALSTEEETVNEGEEATVTFINDTVNQEPDSVSTSLGVTKNVLNINGKQLENCEDTFTFELTADDENSPMPENSIITITGNGTESFGTITFTETGTYSYNVTETAGSLDYYSYDDSIYTIVYEVTNADGLLEVTKTVKKNGLYSDVIEFTNKILKADVKVSKTDEKGNSLNGATLQVLGSEGNVVEEWVTGENKETYTLKLVPGTYTLHEVQAPEGYEVADDIVFVVNEDGTISVNDEIVNEVTMIDLKVEEDPENPDGEDNKSDEENKDTENETENKNLKTGDKIVIYVSVLILALGLLIITIKRKNSK